jgi:hypothetical protein
MIPHVGAVRGGSPRLFRARPQGKSCGDANADGDDAVAGTEVVSVKIAKQELVRLLRTEGDNDTADKAESQLPEEIDTDADDGQLAGIGLDRTQLLAKLAGGSLGGTVAP